MSTGRIAALYRFPVKGFSPEALSSARLDAGGNFPDDRLFAVENGPSGFDVSAPAHISKQKFTVLARAAEIAKLRTRYNEVSGDLEAMFDDSEVRHVFALKDGAGRNDFAKFLSEHFSEQFSGALKVIEGPGGHRFTDHHSGKVSLLNLASLGVLSEAVGQVIDPDRFRMNIHLTGLEAWAEDNWQPGDRLRVGGSVLEVLVPTVRCKATHANPETGAYDLNTVPELHKHFGRTTLGLYATILEGGTVAPDDFVERL
jgi:uncharacterized protein YcbX